MKLNSSRSHFIRFTHKSPLECFHLLGKCVPIHFVPCHKKRTELFGIWSDGPLMPRVPPLVIMWKPKTLVKDH
uniref:Uncharacterized protein n=1 Tax=Rhizophora mucronata TaxID=61149 RepID=A0A2P2JL24_RHIMU